MNQNIVSVILLTVILAFIMPSLASAQLVTAGSYYKDLKTDDESSNALSNDVPVLTEEMFRCSRTVDCGILARKNKNESEFKDVSRDADLTGYDELLEKNKSGFSDCRKLYKWGFNVSTVLDISWRNGSSFQAYCNMEVDGGGWIVFQRRNDTTSFLRNWTEYEIGFGDRAASFWLGLEALHWLTSNTTQKITLRIDITDDNGKKGFAKYQNFVIGSAAEKYRISFGSYTGNIGDGLLRSKDMSFSTQDRDNDVSLDTNCAGRYGGGWWHKNCFDANLNNDHPRAENRVSTPEAEGAAAMSWHTWENKYGNIVYSEMKLKVDES